MYTYIYIYTHLYMYTYVYIYIYICAYILSARGRASAAAGPFEGTWIRRLDVYRTLFRDRQAHPQMPRHPRIDMSGGHKCFN